MGWANAISAEHDTAIRSAILVGGSTGIIARQFGVHRNSVVLRRKSLKEDATPCKCGRAASHKGTCRSRLTTYSGYSASAPIIFSRTRSWRPSTSISYPPLPSDFRNRQLSAYEILAAADAVIPRSLPRQVRDEVRSEMVLAHIEGGLPTDMFGERCRDFVTKVYTMFPDKGAHVSLDAIRGGGGDLYSVIGSDNYE